MRDYGWQGDEPSRTCAGCGERVILKAEPVWFERFPVVRTWHTRCSLVALDVGERRP